MAANMRWTMVVLSTSQRVNPEITAPMPMAKEKTAESEKY
jgi:hypothetical protein